MQPDPQIYLMGAQSTLMDMLEQGALQDAASVLRTRRVAEVLTQMSLRSYDLPTIVATLTSRQKALLDEVRNASSAMGLAHPPARALSETDGALGEYMDRSWEIADTLSMISAGARGISAIHAALFREARQLEADFRRAYDAAVAHAKAKSESARRAAEEERLPQPTPEELEAYLRGRSSLSHAVVRDVSCLIGINTKDIYFFDVADHLDWPASVVMRRLRNFSANKNASMEYEFHLLRAVREAGLPVPRALDFDMTGSLLGAPFIVMEKLRGSAALPGSEARDFGENGPEVGRQIARHLARIHQVDTTRFARPAEIAATPHDLVRGYIEDQYALWAKVRAEPSATIENGYAWVRSHVDDLEPYSVLVHGDFDFRNIMMDGSEVTAILDWERSRLGHPAQDLAYVRQDVEKIMDWEDFLSEYRAAGGHEISEKALRFFDIWAYTFKGSSGAIGLGLYKGGQHHDFLLSSVGFLEGEQWTDKLRSLLDAADCPA